MAWWRPKEEQSPQSRVGARPRTGATTRPVDEVEGSHEEPGPRPTFSDSPTPVYRAPSRSGFGFMSGLPVAFIAILFVAAFALPIFFLLTSIGGDDDIGGLSGPGSGDGPSLIPRERFERAYARVRDEAGSEGSLTVLRIAPERIDAVVRKAGGERASIQVTSDLDVRSFPAGVATAAERGLSLRRLDPALPDRLVRRAARRLEVSPDDIDYLALSAVGGGVGGGGVWSLFFDGGGHVVADLDGSNMRVPGQ